MSDHGFSERVLNRVAAARLQRQRRDRLRLIWPILAILIIAITWSIALFDALIVLRILIEGTAIVSAIGGLENRLATALLGQFAPLPLIASSLLFIAALGWVRYHFNDSLDRP